MHCVVCVGNISPQGVLKGIAIERLDWTSAQRPGAATSQQALALGVGGEVRDLGAHCAEAKGVSLAVLYVPRRRSLALGAVHGADGDQWCGMNCPCPSVTSTQALSSHALHATS